MTRLIGILSGKGGVGKTTLVSNLSSALTELGHDVIAIDANLTTPHLGFHLGVHLAPKTLHDVLRGEATIRSVTYTHPLGFKVVPGSISVNDLTGVDVGRLPEVTLSLLGKSDFIILDCAPSLGREAVTALQSADEILLITNPDLPSVADALKTLKIAEKTNKKILGVVVNRIKGRWDKLTRWEIEDMLNLPVLAEIPEDKNVPESITLKRPIVNYNPYSPASIEIRRLAHTLVGREFRYKKPRSFRILDRLVGWMTG